jgi:hypothetical protein
MGLIVMINPIKVLPLVYKANILALVFTLSTSWVLLAPFRATYGRLDSAIPVAAGKQYPDGNDAVYRPLLHYHKDQHGLLLSKKSKP